jgi:hypothetical protein
MQKLTPTKQPLEKESKVLDRTSDYVKDALKEKEEADCYLDFVEAEDAIQHPAVSSFIQIVQQEQSIQHLASLKQSTKPVPQKPNERAFTEI